MSKNRSENTYLDHEEVIWWAQQKASNVVLALHGNNCDFHKSLGLMAPHLRMYCQSHGWAEPQPYDLRLMWETFEKTFRKLATPQQVLVLELYKLEQECAEKYANHT